MKQIDLNCDLGEGGDLDADLMPLITTANVACGFHAGGPAEALASLELAVKHGVRAGAHPSYPDRDNFGRSAMIRSPHAVSEDCIYQIGALAGLAKSVGLILSHVKPHGTLYNTACRDDIIAAPVVRSASVFGLPVMGLPGSSLESACAGLVPFIPEGFADRRYRPDGSLVPRTESGAFVESPDEAVKQAEWLIRERGVRSLCVHGDNPDALAFVRALRQALKRHGFEIRAFA
jgi:UPF0271 protein